MTQPLVTCVMITADRPKFVARSIRMFQRQTYQNKSLLIFDTGKTPVADSQPNHEALRRVAIARDNGPEGRTIGQLRNGATALAGGDVIVHWDDDDLSHPNRIAEQVSFLQETKASAVGYRSMLAWRAGAGPVDVDPMERTFPVHPGEAWLYTHPFPDYILGTSLVYWRRAWEQHAFKPWNRGEDREWCKRLGMCSATDSVQPTGAVATFDNCDPRMIATIHGGNTSSAVTEFDGEGNRCTEWQRVPEWDGRVRQIIEGGEWE